MKWVFISGITLTVIVMALMEWPKLQNLQKEKRSFIVLSLIGYILAILLVFNPELPGPTQLFEAIYKPFSKILEK